MASNNGRARLRILHVLAPADFGGLERVVQSLLLGQRDRGHHARALAFVDHGRDADHPFISALAADGVDVDAVAVAPRAYGTERRAVRTALKNFRPDVVHTHGARVDVLDASVARRAAVATVSTVHGFTGGDRRNRFYEYLQRRALRKMDAVVAVSARQVGDLVASGVRADRIHTVPNAWMGRGEFLTRADARQQLGIADGETPLVGWIGRLTHEKGADLFLQALALLPSDVRAVAIGGGPERGGLDRLGARLGIEDRLRWTGVIEGAARFLKAFDVFVMSSRTEGTPIVLLEAMAADVPIVVPAVGGIPNVVGPAEAIVVEPDNPSLLADAIRRALDDRSASRIRAAAARSRLANQFAAEPWLDCYDAVYRSICRR